MLNKLLIEHDHIRKTLNLLEMLFLDLCRGRTPDLSMMRSIVVYIQEYPEQSHHPLEDVIYSILLEREEKVSLLHDLVTDHTELELVTRKLRESVELYIKGSFSKEMLKHQLSTFLIRQRQHLYTEEIEIYPLAQRILTKADWKKIQSSVLRKDDPVFGNRTQNDYELLYREIEGNNK
jgi:hemerythrin-like domain-containing protein